ADDPDRGVWPKRHQGGPWDGYLRARLPVGCARYGASQRHRCRWILDRDLDANRRTLRIDGRRHLPHVAVGGDTRVREERKGDVVGVVITKENRFVHIEDSVAI